MIRLQTTKAGVLLPVKARPAGKKNAITGEHDGALKVTVTAAPEKGKANAAIVALLAEQLGLCKSDIALVRGATDGNKQFLLAGIDKPSLEQKLEAVLRSVG